MAFDFNSLIASASATATSAAGHCAVVAQGRGDVGEKTQGKGDLIGCLAGLKSLKAQWEKTKKGRKGVYDSPTELHMLFSDGKPAAIARVEVVPSKKGDGWDNRRRAPQAA